jgi:hypothetical protein
MSTLEALIALLALLAATALFVTAVPHIEPQHEGDAVQAVVDAQGAGREADGTRSHSFARWWDCAEGKCI